MYAKLINPTTLQPLPRDFTRPDGSVVTNYSAPGNQALWLQDGFLPVTEVPNPFPYGQTTFAVVDGAIVQSWEELPAPPAPTISYSKRRIRVALTARGLNGAFTDFLESSTELHQAWDDSVTLDSTDPLFMQALSAFCSSAGVTDPVMQEILSESVAM